MALAFGNNWAARAIEKAVSSGAPAERVAAALATSPRFIQAVRDGMATPPAPPGVVGAPSVAEQTINNLVDALQEMTN